MVGWHKIGGEEDNSSFTSELSGKETYIINPPKKQTKTEKTDENFRTEETKSYQTDTTRILTKIHPIRQTLNVLNNLDIHIQKVV